MKYATNDTKRYYHAASQNFEQFDLSKSRRGSFGAAMYLTDDLDTAKFYGDVVQEYDIPANAGFLDSDTLESKQALLNLAKELYKTEYGHELVIDPKSLGYHEYTPETHIFWRASDNTEFLKAKALLQRYLQKLGYAGIQENDTVALFDPSIAYRVTQQPVADTDKPPHSDDELTLHATPRSADTGPSRADIYTRVTDRILRDLERGVRPWDIPWRTGAPSRPLRFNGERYHGINVLVLWLTAQESGFSSPYWMTFKQARELGGHVRKGEKGTGIAYANTFARLVQDVEGELVVDDKGHELVEEIPFLKSYTVFNADQIEGLPEQYRQSPAIPLDPKTRIQKIEEFLKATGADIRYGGNQAYNSVEGNYIQMPPYEHFKNPEGFAATIVHELVHWTRHPSRLNRNFGRERFGDEGYAMEELVAELGAAFLCADFGIAPKTRDEHSSYIASWLKVLRNDKRAIFTAAAYAQKAADYLHGELKEG